MKYMQPCDTPPINCALNHVLDLGFGVVEATKDGELIIEDIYNEDHTLADVEKMALEDPDHDWRVLFLAPLYNSTFQRQGPGLWIRVIKGRGII